MPKTIEDASTLIHLSLTMFARPVPPPYSWEHIAFLTRGYKDYGLPDGVALLPKAETVQEHNAVLVERLRQAYVCYEYADDEQIIRRHYRLMHEEAEECLRRFGKDGIVV